MSEGDVIAVVDLETSGLDPSSGKVLEVCWAIVHLDTAQVLGLHSIVVQADENPAEKVNGLSPGLLRHGAPVAFPLDLPEVKAIVAHSASFDSKWGAFDSDAPWVCSCDDWTWPRATNSLKLVDLALAHGVGVVSAHRAYSDVLTLCALMERVHETVPLRQQLANAQRPRSTYAAKVTYAQNHLAKEAGFRWHAETKSWRRRLMPQEATALPFAVVEVS